MPTRLLGMGSAEQEPVSTPCSVDCMLGRAVCDEARQEHGWGFVYRNLGFSILYMNTHTQPAITFILNFLGHFVERSQLAHCSDSMCVLGYLDSCTNHDIMIADVMGEKQGQKKTSSVL